MSQWSLDARAPEAIEGVKPPDFAAQYVTAKQILQHSEDLIGAEYDQIKPWLEKTGHNKNTLMGLALSGGGIRSATFSLGVMQALAKHDVLKKMDYLSTVSGGGYIGSSLSWWLREGDKVGLGPDDFPYGSDPEPDSKTDTPAQKRLRYLSQHGKYLTPGKGITLLSVFSVVLRAILVSFAVWLPILIVIMMLLVWLSALLAGPYPEVVPDRWPVALQLGLPLWNDVDWIFRWLVRLAVVLAAFFALACLIYSLRTAAMRGIGLSARRYTWGRIFEKIYGNSLATIAVLVVVGSLPAVAKSLSEAVGDTAIAAPGAVLVGLGSAIWSFFKAGREYVGKFPLGLQVALVSIFVVYGLNMTAFLIGTSIYSVYPGVEFWWWLAGFVAVAYVIGWFANVNYLSPHRFYRDRLMEAFLPNPDNALNNVTGAATKADSVRLSEINNAAAGRGPYHIINTNILLKDSERRRWWMRGGDSFILSPLYCGSNATGWCSTARYLGDGMTLPTAMAVSGVEANPSIGVGGVGLTRDFRVLILMAILNLRLGYWAHHPLLRPRRFPRPNHFRPGTYEVLSLVNVGGMREDRPYVQLSHGGHFENLGVYELVRRKLRLIIVCDGSTDADFKFADLQSMLRRIQDDLGATVRFAGDNAPETLVPCDEVCFPMDTKVAARGHIIGDITYHDESHGKLILLKPTMLATLSAELKAYKAANPDFPQRTAVAQSFDEDEFQAYRELGQHLGTEMLKTLDLPQLIRDVEQANGRYVPMPASR